MGYDVVEGSFFIADPETGVTSPMGWIGGGLTYEGPSDDDVKTISSFQEVSASFTITGRAAEKMGRILLGLPYKHPRQIIHNGRKP